MRQLLLSPGQFCGPWYVAFFYTLYYFKLLLIFQVPSYNVALSEPSTSRLTNNPDNQNDLVLPGSSPPMMMQTTRVLGTGTPANINPPLQSSDGHLQAQLSPPASTQERLYQPSETSEPQCLPSIDSDDDDVSTLAVSLADLRSSSPAPDIDSARECTGVLVEWTAGSVWDTYPYHQHGVRNLPWEPIGFEGNDSWLRLRSKDCCVILLHTEINRLCCHKCAAIPSSSAFRKFVGRATNAAEHTPYSYLTQRQLHSLLVKVTSKYRELTLKVCFVSIWQTLISSF
jgi:hypothetical protein